MARLTREQQRLLVAEALRNLTKPDLLEDSELVDFLEIEANGAGYWPRGTGLSALLTRAAQAVIANLEATPRYAPHSSLLSSVVQGGTIAGWARTQGISREWASKKYWVPLTALVTKELLGAKRPLQAASK